MIQCHTKRKTKKIIKLSTLQIFLSPTLQAAIYNWVDKKWKPNKSFIFVGNWNYILSIYIGCCLH